MPPRIVAAKIAYRISLSKLSQMLVKKVTKSRAKNTGKSVENANCRGLRSLRYERNARQEWTESTLATSKYRMTCPNEETRSERNWIGPRFALPRSCAYWIAVTVPIP